MGDPHHRPVQVFPLTLLVQMRAVSPLSARRKGSDRRRQTRPRTCPQGVHQARSGSASSSDTQARNSGVNGYPSRLLGCRGLRRSGP